MLEDGISLHAGSMAPPQIGPGTAGVATLDLASAVVPQPGREYHLNVYLRQKAAVSWAPAGHEVAREQFWLGAPAVLAPLPAVPSRGALDVVMDDDAVTIQGEDFSVVFDRCSGGYGDNIELFR